jgi:hypothetical protein
MDEVRDKGVLACPRSQFEDRFLALGDGRRDASMVIGVKLTQEALLGEQLSAQRGGLRCVDVEPAG